MWHPRLNLADLSYLQGHWDMSALSDVKKSIMDPCPADTTTAIVTFFGAIESQDVRDSLVSFSDKLHEPLKVSRYSYQTDSTTCYPPIIKAEKTWNGFDEQRIHAFFRKVQNAAWHYKIADKWCDYYKGLKMCSDEMGGGRIFYLYPSRKTYRVEKNVSGFGGGGLEYPRLEVKARIWRNSTHENGARCYFFLQHQGMMTSYTQT